MKTKRNAIVGDLIKITRIGGIGTTKDKEYKVTHTSGGWGGQAVTFYDDDNKLRTVNGMWWDFTDKSNTLIYACFCGTGKTYICEKTKINSIEIEYWKYKEKGLFKEYVEDIKKHFGKVDYIFISTEPDGLKLLHNEGFKITLVYPENKLRNEYLDRYIERDSSYDFIGTFMKHWNIWIDELKNQNYCEHIILSEGEYLQDVL